MLKSKSAVLKKKTYLNGNTLNFFFHKNSEIINKAPIIESIETIIAITLTDYSPSLLTPLIADIDKSVFKSTIKIYKKKINKKLQKIIIYKKFF